MKQITQKEYERIREIHTTSRALDKDNNFVELIAGAKARSFMYLGTAKQNEYYELTLEEFNTKEHELMDDAIYRINDEEFYNVQGFHNKRHTFNITFYVENIDNSRCTLSFWYNDNGVFTRGCNFSKRLWGYFKISDNINQFSTDKIVNRLKKFYPNHNIRQEISVN